LTAGVFLAEFVGETEWAHIDIAGPSFASAPLGYMGKGATGMSVRTVLQVLDDRASRARRRPARSRCATGHRRCHSEPGPVGSVLCPSMGRAGGAGRRTSVLTRRAVEYTPREHTGG